jgi:hypothetical protein
VTSPTLDDSTNAEALAAIEQVLRGLPRAGALYRIMFGQGPEGRPTAFVGEFVGLVRDMGEPALAFILRNPVPPINAQNGIRKEPFILWPLDVLHISPAQPGDLDTPMHYHRDGEPDARTPGNARLQ